MANQLSKEQLIIETCCGSADDVIQSELAGADRAELNSALFLGGLTPTIGALKTALENTSKIKIVTMVRPRAGGFCYTEAEFNAMLKDAQLLLQNGSRGIVFGFLHEDGTVDTERCRKMVEIIGPAESIFHRAIDVVPDWKETIDILAELGVNRILTSGQRGRAYDGCNTIRNMIEYAAGRIEILPGAGIRENNALEIIRATGCRQLHMSRRKTCTDSSVQGNKEICFGNPAAPEEYTYEMIDGAGFGQGIAQLKAQAALL